MECKQTDCRHIQAYKSSSIQASADQRREYGKTRTSPGTASIVTLQSSRIGRCVRLSSCSILTVTNLVPFQRQCRRCNNRSLHVQPKTGFLYNTYFLTVNSVPSTKTSMGTSKNELDLSDMPSETSCDIRN
ncbi:hypothetical protein Mapa_010120 [Marchantia paleacea]|nr:hypothetical protein Mapa_010120 [Marchantia paleacea]